MKKKFLLGVLAICCLLSTASFSYAQEEKTITLRTTGCNLQKVEILDVNGRVLHAATLNGTETFDYNVSQMPSGIYLARVKTSCGVLTEKFSVK